MGICIGDAMKEQPRYFRKIEGEKLYLSPMNPEDYHQYAIWINDLSISRGLGNSTANYSLPAEKAAIEKLAGEGHNYAIVRSEDDQLLGNCSLFDIDHYNRKATLGIFIGSTTEHNKGYGREAIMLLLSYGFKFLNLNNIMLNVYSHNENAVALYKKCGFREFGRRTQACLLGGRYHDDLYMEILAENFESSYLDDKLP